jgi:glycosyltransferase involved in cell wall biosynthesis
MSPASPIEMTQSSLLASALRVTADDAEVPYEEGVRRTLNWFKLKLVKQVEPPKAPAPVRLNGSPISGSARVQETAHTAPSLPRIALISAGSPFDRRSWSGIPFYVHRELSRRYGAVRVVDTPRLDWVVDKISRRLPMGVFLAREPIVVALYRRILERRLARLGADLVVSVNAPHKVVDLPPEWPVIHFEDADFETIVGYHPAYQRANARSRAIGREVQRRLLTRGASIIVNSEWAAHGAARNSGLPEQRFLIAPMGANLDDDPGQAPLRSNQGELSLLFVGYDWDRKGGPIVLATFLELKRRLGRVALHVVGATPKEARDVEGVVIHGALSKSNPEERDRLVSLFRSASFFFMPSRAEPYGLVYCEACAFGLPPVATDTGGVGTIITHGVNGLLLPASASAFDYARAIEQVWSDDSRYAAMQARARKAFEGRLNWRAWGDVLNAAIRSELQAA